MQGNEWWIQFAEVYYKIKDAIAESNTSQVTSP